MSRVGLKIGLVTTLLLLIAVAGLASAKPIYTNGTEPGKNVTLSYNTLYQLSGRTVTFTFNTTNTSATTWWVNITYTDASVTNVCENMTLSGNSTFTVWAEVSAPANITVTVRNPDNSTEIVSVDLRFIPADVAKLVFDLVAGTYIADGKAYDVDIYLADDTENYILPTEHTFTVEANTTLVWLKNESDTVAGGPITLTTNNLGKVTFQVAAYNNNKEVTALLTASGSSGSKVITFAAPTELAYLTGDYRTTDGTPLDEASVVWEEDYPIYLDYDEDGVEEHIYTIPNGSTGIYIIVINKDSRVIIYEGLDTTSGAGYSVQIPSGANYTVYGFAYTFKAATCTVYVDEPDRTFTADLVFKTNRVPTKVIIEYEDGTKSKVNYASGKETDDEMLVVYVYDQYGDPISDTVTVTIEPPGDLNVHDPDTFPDGSVDTSVVVQVTNGVGYVWVTCLGANESTMTKPIVTVNITATSNTNRSASDVAYKTYVLKGNSSIFGQVYWVNEETGEKGPAIGATVWAVYAEMTNHSLYYIKDVMPWMVDTVDEHGVYVLDGIAVPTNETTGFTEVFIYVIYSGWNGINDTIGAPSLASQGELDPVFEADRGGRTNMYIAAAEVDFLWADGDTENHDIKLDNPEPIDYEINLIEDTHYLTFNGTGYDKATITITLVYYSEANPSEKYPAAYRDIKVNVTGVEDALLAADGQIGREVWVTTDENGTATLTFYAGTTAGEAVVTAYFDTKTEDQGIISASGEKHIVETGSISFDVCDQTGTQLDWLAREGRIIAVLWMDNTTSHDRVFNPDNDWIIAANLVDPLSGFATKNYYAAQLEVPEPPFDTLEVFEVVHGVPGDRLKNPFNIPVMPFNARYVAKDGHASFDGVVPGHRYYVEAIVVKPNVVETLNESVIRTGYAIVDKQSGTDTADVYVYIPPDWRAERPSETTATLLKQQILSLILEYIENPSEDLKQQILAKILEYMKYV